MKYVISIFIFSIFIFSANGQVQKNSLRGRILDANKNALAGVSVIIVWDKNKLEVLMTK